MGEGSIRIMIADDHPVVREGLAAMLSREPDIEVVGEARDGQEAVERVEALHPDIVLMDLQMPRLDGVEAIRQIRARHADVQTIVLTTYGDDDSIFSGIEAGARGYLLKDAPRDELFRAVRAVARGESLLQPAVATRLLDRFARGKAAPTQETLTERELDVLRLLARGAANKEIGAQLHISESTVKTHVANIFQKLGVTDRTEAVTVALTRGLLRL
ncbi:MAG TPA: response regulator transcription factor [Thermomicrobiales bacterium]|nr:response regulator transcription factor [Thermomicrobiales bacterium]